MTTPSLHLPAGLAAPVLKYLGAYPAPIVAQVAALIGQGRLPQVLQQRYPERHAVQSDTALYAYVSELKAQHLRGADPIHKVAYDSKLKVIQHALGTHTMVSRVQGGKFKAKREIRVASLFREGPPEFLRMIVAHELGHLKEREHNKAFYALCTHIDADYQQHEFDLRLWLVSRELFPASA